jgi:hypothetical protein
MMTRKQQHVIEQALMAISSTRGVQHHPRPSRNYCIARNASQQRAGLTQPCRKDTLLADYMKKHGRKIKCGRFWTSG